jgi:hypothetical protein
LRYSFWLHDTYTTWLKAIEKKLPKGLSIEGDGYDGYCSLIKKLHQWVIEGNDTSFIKEFYCLEIDQLFSPIFRGVLEKDPGPFDSWDAIKESLLETRKKIKDVSSKKKVSPLFREWRRFKSRWNLDFNPLNEGNFPYLFYELEVDGKRVLNLRMGSPTEERLPFCKAKVIPEFSSFIKGKRKHLYFNFQARHTPWYSRITGINDERARCHAIEELDQKECFSVSTFSKNSEFYLQKGNSTLLQEWGHFKDNFIDELFHSGNCYFSKDLPEKRVDPLLDAIHREYLEGVALLTKEQAILCIELFYLFFSFDCLLHLQPDSVNYSCTDCIDRGISANSIVLWWLLQEEYQEDWDYLGRCLHYALFVPALLVRQREIRSSRLERFILVAPFVMKKTELGDWYRNKIKLTRVGIH